MPSINRIRVNNVKYNFGTQQYDDFSMRMYGKNTLYDLANGGGKSILMLLLLQNLIPNCTLDDKQPIEKLFRAGGGNTTIHSLIEWKLDEPDIKDGYRYMTTGFCARKAKDAPDENDGSKATAAIEYFNYCIFYRDYNRNDIVNLPLSKGNEKITFSGLKTYLKELSHKDMGLEIRVFERKGEYQRFISGYGLHESHWEIIRGINKTEGHVRTYFETNYKTTRKVVEDLLIEEIIEKAFMTKTGRNGEEDTMAETLLDIKDKLNVLAQRKRDIANYDHQIELMNVLEAKVNSCIGLYEEYDKISMGIADVYTTGKAYQESSSKQLEELAADKGKKYANKEKQKLRLENLKVARDFHKLAELADTIDETAKLAAENKKRIEDLKYQINYKESINDYLNYLKDKKQYEESRLIAENIMNNIGSSDDKLAVYAVNRKIRDDAELCKQEEIRKAAEAEFENSRMEAESCIRLIKESEITCAVARSNIKERTLRIGELKSKIGAFTSGVSVLVSVDAEDMYRQVTDRKNQLVTKLASLEEKRETMQKSLYDEKYNLVSCEAECENIEKQLDIFKKFAEEYNEAQKKISGIMSVYDVKSLDEAEKNINERIKGTISETMKREGQIEELKARLKNLQAGKVLQETDGVRAVIDYIATRHGHMAMHGADYISALPVNVRDEILSAHPAIAYGVVTKGYQDIADDINLGTIDTCNECVCVYDIDNLKDAAPAVGNMVIIGKNKEYFTSEEIAERLISETRKQIDTLFEEIILINEKLSTYQEDLKFVNHISDENYTEAADNERSYNRKLILAKDNCETLRRQIADLEFGICKADDEKKEIGKELSELDNDASSLRYISELMDMLSKEEQASSKDNDIIKRAEHFIDDKKSELLKWNTKKDEAQSKLDSAAAKIEEIHYKWNKYFAPYMPETDAAASALKSLDIDDITLENEFMAMIAVAQNKVPDLEDKKKLMEALSKSMDRLRKAIEKRGIDIAIFENAELYPVNEDSLAELDTELCRLNETSEALAKKTAAGTNAHSKLEGSIEYAVIGINKSYGEGSYVKEDISISEIESAIQNGDKVLADLEMSYKQAAYAYEEFYKKQGFMTDLYKDVNRIVSINEIDVSGGRILDDDIDALRHIFEENLLKFDRSRKNLDKAKNELMKFKGQTAELLSSMGVFEMAATIREDVVIPDTYEDAKMLLENLIQIIDFIQLEKGRVEKGIEDMVAIKDNFENQCIQRCMDVKTELEKLPKLSRITVGDEVIKMVDLNIPYVKDEFVKQRMSDYIDDIVKNADSYDDERKRIRFIRDCLGLKKLFGVMVTDMNNIKLNLYKRERIREQSRYLKYEEAVGSTGQSQGIYIQFLVAVINYIAGMYTCNAEDTVSSKTIFIDNPFGAAKDIYIWEPIFAMLTANHVQLIVPARGATPAITGRFDVNYILGQKMVGGKQQTVVTNYTSKTNQEELEYQELSYEQATFDFI